MPRTRLPAFQFEAGLRLTRWLSGLSFQAPQAREELFLIGRLDTGEPFALAYRHGGLTQWDCPVTLGAALRQKILQGLREQVRFAATAPAWLDDHDLQALDRTDLAAGHARAGDLASTFYTQRWERDTLGLTDWVPLAVPFADKEQAKALGATWDAVGKTWRVRQQADMAPFAAWRHPA
jgi:hypothetical protein